MRACMGKRARMGGLYVVVMSESMFSICNILSIPCMICHIKFHQIGEHGEDEFKELAL